MEYSYCFSHIDPADVNIGIDITRGPVDVHGDLLGPLTWMLKVLAVRW